MSYILLKKGYHELIYLVQDIIIYLNIINIICRYFNINRHEVRSQESRDRLTIIKRYMVENVNNRQKTWMLVLSLVLLPQNSNMDFLEYKGYKGSVEYSKEDNCLFGKVQGMS
jgi:hypothetical protein